MTMPPARAWLFALRTYVAAIAALWIAFSMGLTHPGWAVTTVFIASQSSSAATRSKSLYRALGTVIGAVAAVVMVPNLSSAPELLTLALSLWVALCLGCSLLDRSPRSYVYMLGGYSAALIGLPSVQVPGDIFMVAVSRVEEILLGISCAALVHSLVLPTSIGKSLLQRLDSWISEARTLSAAAMRPDLVPDTSLLRKRLAGYAMEVENLAANLPYDTSELRRAAPAVRYLHRQLALILGLLSSIHDRVSVMRLSGASLPDGAAQLLEHIEASLTDRPGAQSLAALRQEIADASPPLTVHDVESGESHSADWATIQWSGLLMRMSELLARLEACQRLRRGLDEDGWKFGIPKRLQSVPVQRHVDYGLVLLSSFTVFVTLVATNAFWILTAWPDGATAPMIAAVMCSFFSTMDNPVNAIRPAVRAATVAAIIATIYAVFILPSMTSFEMLALSLAPALIFMGLLIAQPKTFLIGMILATMMATLVGLNNRYSASLDGMINGSISLIFGLSVAQLVTGILRSRSTAWSIARILRTGWRDVQTIARLRGRRAARLEQREAFAQRTMDRLYLLLPRMAALPAGSNGPNPLIELRIGSNIVDLQNLRGRLEGDAAHEIDALLRSLADFCRQRAALLDDAPSPPSLLAQLDHCMNVLAATPQLRHRRDLMLAIAGLRIVLYPDAAAFTPETQPPHHHAAPPALALA